MIFENDIQKIRMQCKSYLTSVDLSTQWERFQYQLNLNTESRLKPYDDKFKREIPLLATKEELKKELEEKASLYDFSDC